MLGNSVRLFAIRGIEVGVHASWLVVFGLVTWSLSTSYFPQVLRGISPAEAWLLGAASAILLFASVLAYGFMTWGFVWVLGGELFNGIWMAAIGWFLQGAGHASLQQVILEQRLRRIKVGDIMRPDPTAVLPDLAVADLIERYLLPSNRRAMPVAQDGRL